jgi:hypothetical protein
MVSKVADFVLHAPNKSEIGLIEGVLSDSLNVFDGFNHVVFYLIVLIFSSLS